MKTVKTLLLLLLVIIVSAASLHAQAPATATPAATKTTTPATAPPTAVEPAPEIPKNAVVYHSEIFVGYGAPTNSDIIVPLLKMFGTVATLGGYSEQNVKMRGALSVGYKYRFDKVASLGLTYAFGTSSGDVYWSNEFWGRSRGVHHTIAVECDFRYITRRVVNLYSTVGLAATIARINFTSNDPNDQQLAPFRFTLPDFHVSLIGVKVGGYRFGGFAELGMGYKGIINFGAYVRF